MRKCANLCVSETRFLERDVFRRHFVSTADERAMDVVVDNVAVLASAREDVIVPCKRPNSHRMPCQLPQALPSRCIVQRNDRVVVADREVSAILSFANRLSRAASRNFGRTPSPMLRQMFFVSCVSEK